jgi:nicotinamide mononucleotide transporter
MFSRIKNFIQNECSNWNRFEIIWLVFSTLVIIGISIKLKDNFMGITASLCAIWYSLLAGKGKLSCYFFGIINTILYGYISYKHKLFGEVMLNWGWYLPMMFVGLFCWRKNLTKNHIIVKTDLSWTNRIVFLVASCIAIAGYTYILQVLKGSQPWLDSTTTILSITAMILTVKRCIEQWLLWTVINMLSIYMWLKVYLVSDNEIAILLMWILSLVNGIIFFIQWAKEVKKNEIA